MTMAWSQGITRCRGPMSSPTSSTFLLPLTTVSTHPLRLFPPGFNTCSLALRAIFRYFNKPWLTQMTGGWHEKSHGTMSSMTMSWWSPSELNSTNMTLTPCGHSWPPASLDLCLPMLQSGLQLYRTCPRSWDQCAQGGGGVVVQCTKYTSAPHHWMMSNGSRCVLDVHRCPSSSGG
jgi:hypothetical protein